MKIKNLNSISDGLKFCIALSVLVISGCEEAHKCTSPEPLQSPKIMTDETRNIRLVTCSNDFVISEEKQEKLRQFLKEVKTSGITNVSFTIISNEQIPEDRQTAVKSTILNLMYKEGFIKSRIIDSGVCVYKDANPGIRVDALKYDLKDPNCDEWEDDIGDMDETKPLPKFGYSASYNLNRMIANKADISNPRKYIGMTTTEAIKATTASASAS